MARGARADPRLLQGHGVEGARHPTNGRREGHGVDAEPDLVGAQGRRVKDVRDAPVEQLHAAEAAHPHMGRLHVQMKHPTLVGAGQDSTDCGKHPQHKRQRQQLARRRRPSEATVQAFSVQLRHQHRTTVGEVNHGRHTRVLQPGEQPRFTGQPIRIGRQLTVGDLARQHAPKPPVHDAGDFTKTTTTKPFTINVSRG